MHFARVPHPTLAAEARHHGAIFGDRCARRRHDAGALLSQVVLSLVLPVPMIALLILTQRRDIMVITSTVAHARPVIGAAAIEVRRSHRPTSSQIGDERTFTMTRGDRS